MLMKLFGSFILLIFFIIFGPVNAQAAGFGALKYGEAGYGYGTTTQETSAVPITGITGTNGTTTLAATTTSETALAATSETAAATTSEVAVATTSSAAASKIFKTILPSTKPAAAPIHIEDKKTPAPRPTTTLISAEKKYSAPVKTLVAGIIINILKIAWRVVQYKLWQVYQFLFSIF